MSNDDNQDDDYGKYEQAEPHDALRQSPSRPG
jgi:hypothetical protein